MMLSQRCYKDYVSFRSFKTIFFLQSDIDEFSKYETELDDQLINKDLTFQFVLWPFDEKNGRK
jgi:carboxyl-terminal processing protease